MTDSKETKTETKEEVIFVTQDKHRRAKEIVAGKTSGEINQDTVSYWRGRIADEKPKDAVRFVYEGLGGVVRTHEEQVVFEKKVEEMKKQKSKGLR